MSLCREQVHCLIIFLRFLAAILTELLGFFFSFCLLPQFSLLKLLMTFISSCFFSPWYFQELTAVPVLSLQHHSGRHDVNWFCTCLSCQWLSRRWKSNTLWGKQTNNNKNKTTTMTMTKKKPNKQTIKKKPFWTHTQKKRITNCVCVNY